MITYIDAIIESPLTQEQAAELAYAIADTLREANVTGTIDVSQVESH